jgi:hypothetical protein
MRRNRKMPKKMSVMAGRSVQIGAVMVMAFAMVILNMLASSSCKQLSKTISEKERQLAKLENDQKREQERWDEMKTPERLEAALLKHGLAMRYSKPETQVVRMDKSGRPYSGQASVARATERSKAAQSAKYTPVRNPARNTVTTRRRR